MGGLAERGAEPVRGTRPTRLARCGVTPLSRTRCFASILALMLAAAAPPLLAFALAVALFPSPGAAGPTPEEYVAHVGGNAKIVPPGELKLDGYRLVCGQRPTVLDNNLDDYGAAYPGFLILNPKLLAKVSLPVKLWIHAHECGHQFRGPDEETADCFAVQRGRRQRWLTPEGLEEVCRFIAPAKGDSMHFSGSHRCEAMRACYTDPEIK
jgi:hypothetical protein